MPQPRTSLYFAIKVNTIVVKKLKKNKNIVQVKSYTWYKIEHYKKKML